MKVLNIRFLTLSIILISLHLRTPTAFGEEKVSSPLQGFGDLDSSQPTYISANALTLFNAERRFTYDGGVVVEQGDMTIKGETLSGNYTEKNEIIELVVTKNVEIIKKEQLRATGGRAVYNKLNETIILTDSPTIEQNGSQLSADKITVFVQDNRSVAEGSVKVKLIKQKDESNKPAKP